MSMATQDCLTHNIKMEESRIQDKHGYTIAINIYIYIYTHTYIQTYTHICMYVCMYVCVRSMSEESFSVIRQNVSVPISAYIHPWTAHRSFVCCCNISRETVTVARTEHALLIKLRTNWTNLVEKIGKSFFYAASPHNNMLLPKASEICGDGLRRALGDGVEIGLSLFLFLLKYIYRERDRDRTTSDMNRDRTGQSQTLSFLLPGEQILCHHWVTAVDALLK